MSKDDCLKTEKIEWATATSNNHRKQQWWWIFFVYLRFLYSVASHSNTIAAPNRLRVVEALIFLLCFFFFRSRWDLSQRETTTSAKISHAYTSVPDRAAASVRLHIWSSSSSTEFSAVLRRFCRVSLSALTELSLSSRNHRAGVVEPKCVPLISVLCGKIARIHFGCLFSFSSSPLISHYLPHYEELSHPSCGRFRNRCFILIIFFRTLRLLHTTVVEGVKASPWQHRRAANKNKNK